MLGPPSTPLPMRALYLALYLVIIPYELASLLGLLAPPSSTARHATIALRAPPPCHGAASAALHSLGPWAPYLDVCSAPAYASHAAEPFTQLTAHERNLDFNSFLYAEEDLFYVFDAGPSCLSRHYGNVGKFAYKVPEYNDATRLVLEIDGVRVLNASLRELFMAPPSPLDGARHGEASSFSASERLPQPARARWPSRSPLFPVLTYAMERNESLLGAWQLSAPFCAARRLRLAFQFGQLWDAATFPALDAGPDVHAHTAKVMAGASACIWEDTRCPVVHYSTITGVRFPGGALPPGWLTPTFPDAAAATGAVRSGAHGLRFPSAEELARAGLPAGDLTHLWNAARLLGQAERAAAAAAAAASAASRASAPWSTAGCGRLSPGGEPLVLFSSPPGAGAGVVTAITLDFPAAKHLLHSPHVLLEAIWDDEEGEGGGGGGGAPTPAPAASTSSTWATDGWSDERPIPSPAQRAAAYEAGRAAAAARRRAGARLTVDLEALLGPTHMHRGHTPSCRKELYYLGELPPEGYPLPSGAARGGLYLTLPAPFWRSARIQVRWTGGSGSSEAWGASPPAPPPPPGAPPPTPGAEACWAIAATPGGSGAAATYPAESSGYLQGAVRAFDMGEGMPGNVLAEVAGQRGAFMLLAMHVRAAQKNFVEGDVRAWSDGNPTPALWDSGFEDFFQGSHAYERVHHSCGEPFYTWDRAEPPNWNGGCPPDHPPCDMHFFQIRALLHDAMPFRQGFRVAIEGNPRTYHAAVRAAALWYGAPAPPLLVSDWVAPGEEHEAGARGPHAYTLAAPRGDTQEYALAAVIPSLGEAVREESVEGVERGWPAGGAYPSLGGRTLTVARTLRLGAGAAVSFTVAVHPRALAVHLRRLVDTRVGVQLARGWANGVALGPWVSSDRHYGHLGDSSWKVEGVVLPAAATRGASTVNVTLRVEHDELEGGSGGRVYPPFHHGPGWTEARWQVLCEMPW